MLHLQLCFALDHQDGIQPYEQEARVATDG